MTDEAERARRQVEAAKAAFKPKAARRAVTVKGDRLEVDKGARVMGADLLAGLKFLKEDLVEGLNKYAARVQAALDKRTALIEALQQRVADLEARPSMVHRGIWRENLAYYRGDVVMDQGSVWHCRQATEKARPGRGSCWQLIAKGDAR
jgi:hypothetical protein